MSKGTKKTPGKVVNLPSDPVEPIESTNETANGDKITAAEDFDDEKDTDEPTVENRARGYSPLPKRESDLAKSTAAYRQRLEDNKNRVTVRAEKKVGIDGSRENIIKPAPETEDDDIL